MKNSFVILFLLFCGSKIYPQIHVYQFWEYCYIQNTGFKAEDIINYNLLDKDSISQLTNLYQPIDIYKSCDSTSFQCCNSRMFKLIPNYDNSQLLYYNQVDSSVTVVENSEMGSFEALFSYKNNLYFITKPLPNIIEIKWMNTDNPYCILDSLIIERGIELNLSAEVDGWSHLYYPKVYEDFQSNIIMEFEYFDYFEVFDIFNKSEFNRKKKHFQIILKV